jgi:hypothetical protein
VRLSHRIALFALVATLAVPSSASAQPINFVASYAAEGANEGFSDPALGAARRAAFEFALNRIGNVFTARYSGETVVVSAVFDPLGGTANSATLGFASPAALHGGVPNAPVSGVFYPTALANHRRLSDGNGGTAEINITFNTSVDDGIVLGSSNWYYGTDGNAGIHSDLISVAMHEIGHGLGFTGLLNSSGQYNNGGGQATIYDHFMNTSSSGGTKLRNLATDAARAAEAIGNDLWWDGALGTAGNGGNRPKLHAPNPFAGGSSLYHLDETVHENEMLSPEYDGVDQTFSAMELGMLADMGWTIAPVPEPATVLSVAALALGALGGLRRLRRRPAAAQ